MTRVVPPSGSTTAVCGADGADYSWVETVSRDTRTINWSGCPNHATANLNPHHAVKELQTYQVPAVPQYSLSQQTDLSAAGGVTGVTYDGGMIFSAFAAAVTLTDYQSSAPYLEGYSFDQCGGHSSSTSKASYHYHVPPSCLLAQLGMSDGAHSPQVGWMADGFPVYGPLGPSGTAMKTCTVTGGTIGQDVCTDDCGGYYGDTGDGYKYRYYMMGTFNDGKCTELPAQAAGGGADYFPFTPKCLRGCCPAGATCSMGSTNLPPCSGSAEAGTTSSFVAGQVTPQLAVNSQGVNNAAYAAASESSLCCDTAYIDPPAESSSPKPTQPCSTIGHCATSVTCAYATSVSAASANSQHSGCVDDTGCAQGEVCQQDGTCSASPPSAPAGPTSCPSGANSECPQGLVCSGLVGNKCHSPCSSDGECTSMFLDSTCGPTFSDKCERKSCSAPSDCTTASDMTCGSPSNKCEVKSCTSPSDCSSNLCDSVSSASNPPACLRGAPSMHAICPPRSHGL